MKWNRFTKWFIVFAVAVAVSYIFGFVFNCIVSKGFHFKFDVRLLIHDRTLGYAGLMLLIALIIWLMYYHKHYWIKNSKKIIKGDERDNDLTANLENARFQTDEEIKKNFKHVTFEELAKKHISGIAVRAVQKDGVYEIDFAAPAHTLVIGTTGSGKTSGYISPMIQLLSQSAAKSSMVISDPKGEIYLQHAKSLRERGYRVRILDLRNPFNSMKWNPLERPFKLYRRMLNLKDEPKANEEHGYYTFERRKYYDIKKLNEALNVKRQELEDIVFDDLNDIITVLCPVTNRNEPVWENGARNMVLGIALAMLEDSGDERLGKDAACRMTIDRYNFYNIKAVAGTTDNDCAELINYFKGRKPTSRCLTFAKQVLDTSEKTRGSYVSTMFDKLNLFSDLSLCAMTSASEIDFFDLDERPTAVFLQIPDERDTRHALASMVILQAYKELVHKANTYKDLTLKRAVHFLLDEFGQVPAIPKLEQMITVGRSRNIWFSLVVQSYAQLSKVYDEKVADIVKSNCNIQIFIGSTDQKTIDDYSKRCGNRSVITRSVGIPTVKGDDINSNMNIKERPLIYPSELSKLNGPGNYGNAVVTIFGFQPILSKFTPCYLVKDFKLGGTKQQKKPARYFDEDKIFYDIRIRNKLVLPPGEDEPKKKRKSGVLTEQDMEIEIKKLEEKIEKAVGKLLDAPDKISLDAAFKNAEYGRVIELLSRAREAAILKQDYRAGNLIESYGRRISELIYELIGSRTAENNQMQMQRR